MRYGFSQVNIKSKEHLNQYLSDEQIIGHYFGEFEPDTYYISPRGESSPSLRFSYYDHELKWRDFGESVLPRDSVEFVMYLSEIEGKKLTFHDALQKIYDEVGKTTNQVKFPKIQKKKGITSIKFRRQYKNWELEYWSQYHIDKPRLDKFRVFPCEVWYNENLWHRSLKGDPYYVYMWDKKRGIWKAYRPYGEDIKTKRGIFRTKFFGNNICNHIQGWEYLPEKGENLIITKSYKDIMVLDILGYPAIAPHSESMFIPRELVNQLKSRFKNIYVNYDNDKPGVKKSIEFTEKHNLDYWNIPKNYEISCKDPSDLAKNYGLGELQHQLLLKIKKDSIYPFI